MKENGKSMSNLNLPVVLYGAGTPFEDDFLLTYSTRRCIND